MKDRPLVYALLVLAAAIVLSAAMFMVGTRYDTAGCSTQGRPGSVHCTVLDRWTGRLLEP